MLLLRSCGRRPLSYLLGQRNIFKSWKQERLVSDSSAKDKNLYRILGVSPNATQMEIKDAYYNLTLKFHPDRNEGSPEAAVKFHEITEAYEVLGNYYMRKRYDRGMPLPSRHEMPPPDTVPHVVKYQEFFDRRNLPYQPSAYAAGGGARKFDEYHSMRFAEHNMRNKQEMDQEREFKEMCKARQTPTIFALVIFLCIVHMVKQEYDIYVGPLIEVEHYDKFTD